MTRKDQWEVADKVLNLARKRMEEINMLLKDIDLLQKEQVGLMELYDEAVRKLGRR